MIGASPRYLLVRGEGLALRLALPAFGRVQIGRGTHCDVQLDQPDIDDIHAVLHIDQTIRLQSKLRRLRVVREHGADLVLDPDETKPIDAGDEVRLGSVRVRVSVRAPLEPRRRILDATAIEARLASTSEAVTVLRVHSTDAASEVEAALLAAAPAGAMIAKLRDGEYAVLADGPVDDAAVSALSAGDGHLQVGVATSDDTEVADLLDAARQRLRRSSPVKAPSTFIKTAGLAQVLQLVDQVAVTSSHVLILGDTGVGKDHVARMIHSRSERADRPLVRVNCVDFPDSLADEPMSGSEDSDTTASGHTSPLLAAAAGTVLLDEIGALSLRAQIRLAHLLDSTDDNEAGPAVRVLATSNHDLAADVEAGRFRKDLYFRINRVTIRIPSLTDRSGDVVPLAKAFLQAKADRSGAPPAKVSAAAERRLVMHPWPGNVRELGNIIDRALLLSTGDTIDVEHLPQNLGGGPPDEPSPQIHERPRSLRDELAALEKQRILEALDAHATQTEAAKSLDMPLRTFLNRLDTFGIPRSRKKNG